MIAPHMDPDLATKVLHMRWFAEAKLPPPSWRQAVKRKPSCAKITLVNRS
jgi:hypothetical protein